MTMRRGFTLLETILYIALLSIILVAMITSAYALMRASAHSEDSTWASTEGLFVMNKIEWILSATSSAARIISPAPGAHSNSLSLITPNADRVTITRNGNGIDIQTGNTISPLTSSRVRVSSLSFYNSGATIEASTTIDGETFTTLHEE
jgi:type II secretory pathway component PulJ